MTTAPLTSSQSSVVVIVQAQVVPGQEHVARQLISGFVGPTRLEPGCLQYRLLSDPADDSRIVLIEEWQDEAALQAHNATPGYAELMATLAPLLAGEGSGMFLRAVA